MTTKKTSDSQPIELPEAIQLQLVPLMAQRSAYAEAAQMMTAERDKVSAEIGSVIQTAAAALNVPKGYKLKDGMFVPPEVEAEPPPTDK